MEREKGVQRSVLEGCDLIPESTDLEEVAGVDMLRCGLLGDGLAVLGCVRPGAAA